MNNNTQWQHIKTTDKLKKDKKKSKSDQNPQEDKQILKTTQRP